MEITKHKVATLSYTLTTDHFEGEVVESIDNDKPQLFLFGTGQLLPKFEEGLDGKKAGDQFMFSINSEDAYGPFDPHAVLELPMDTFEVNGEIDWNVVKLGNTVPMRDNHGNRHNGIITEIGVDNLKMDFNHPLAGKNIYFKGEVHSVREATEDELNPKGGCGCGSGGCGSGKEKGHDHHGHEGEDCGVCGNPPEKQGQGIGSCQCT